MSDVISAANTFFKLREAAKVGSVADDIMDAITIAEDSAIVGLLRAIVSAPKLSETDVQYGIEAARLLAQDLRSGNSPRLVLLFRAMAEKLDAGDGSESEPEAPKAFNEMTNDEKLRDGFRSAVDRLPAMFASKAA